MSEYLDPYDVLPCLMANCFSSTENGNYSSVYLLETKTGRQFVFDRLTSFDKKFAFIGAERSGPTLMSCGFIAPDSKSRIVVSHHGMDIAINSIAWVTKSYDQIPENMSLAGTLIPPEEQTP